MLAPARPRRLRDFDDDMDAIRSAFSSKNANDVAIGDAMANAVAEEGEPLPLPELRRRFEEWGMDALFPGGLLSVGSLERVARGMAGLRVDRKAVAIDADSLPTAVAALESRLRVFRALRNVRAYPEEIPPRTVADIVGGVKALVSDCCDPDWFPAPRGKTIDVSVADRASTLAVMERVLGRSPQLEAFLALLVTGGDVDVADLARVAERITDAPLPKKESTLFADALSFADIMFGRVRFHRYADEQFAHAVAATRRSLSSLRALMPKIPRPARASRSVPTGVVEPLPPPRHPPQPTHPPVATGKAFGTLANGHAKASGAAKRRPHEHPEPSRIGDAVDENDAPVDPRMEKTIIATTDARMGTDFDFIRDNPGFVQRAIEQYMAETGSTYAEAELFITRKLRRKTAVKAAPLPQEPVDPRTSWPLVPPPAEPLPDVWDDGEVRVPDSEMPFDDGSGGPKTILEAILEQSNMRTSREFRPRAGEGFESTLAVPGSDEKLNILAERIRNGMPLWHDEDRRDFSGVTSVRLSDEEAKRLDEIQRRERLDERDEEQRKMKADGERVDKPKEHRAKGRKLAKRNAQQGADPE